MSLIQCWNILAALIIFIHSACALSVKQWRFRQPELWAHSLLAAAALAVAASAVTQTLHSSIAETILNTGMAGYFLAQSWRRIKATRFKS